MNLLVIFFVTMTSQAFWGEASLSLSGVDENKVKNLEQYAFSSSEKFQTDSLLIVKDSKLIYEKYSRGYNEEHPHIMWSMSKSLVSLFYGLLVKDGLIDVQNKANNYIESLDPRITLDHLLKMSDGLKWNESYSADPIKSDVVKMLYSPKVEDMGLYAATRVQQYAPGEHFNYSSGASNILTKILKIVLGKKEYESFFWDRLFTPLGIKSATCERDRSGNYIGSSYCYMRPRDLLKVGLLLLQNGRWDKRQILPKYWVSYMTTLAPSVNKTKLSGTAKSDSYGAHWWLNKDLPLKSVQRKFPDAPESLYFAQGFHGQSLFILPEQNALMLRMGHDSQGKIDKNKMLKLLMEAL